MLSDNSHRTKVLIVDDEDKILRFLELKLSLCGYDVATVSNGHEALSHVKSNTLDILVLDILMPVMDGFEVLEELRKSSELPVVVVSAKSDNAEKAMELGANDFICKPFKPDELIARIEGSLAKQGKL
jgi:DNA-binding response OmpR family regulator